MDKNFRIRLGIAFLLISLLGAGVLVRAACLMLIPSDRISTAMNRQFRLDPPRMPRRGYILDRNREPIAVSNEVKSLFANPAKVKDRWLAASLLAKPLDMPAAAIRAKLKSEHAFVWIKRQLSDTEEAAVEEIFERHPSLGLSLGLSKESRRFYPDKGLASQLMGFTGLDSNGLEGIELFYEKDLSGAGNTKAGSDGRTVVATIDKALQYALEEELARGLKESGGVAATAMIMDADKGDIVAMASAPTFNGNTYGQSTADQRRNRSVTDTYEPGSVMKPLMVSGAVEQGVITPKSKVFCEFGKYQIGKHWVHESEAKDKWGWLPISEVLQRSSNVGATKIGFLYGADRMFQWYKHMGIGERTGIDLPGEQSGGISHPEKWSKIQQANIAFGQGLTVTPLQVLRGYSAIANGGTLVTPRLVKELRTFEGELIRELPPGPRRKVMEKKTALQVQAMLEGVATDEGTAPKAAIPGFTVIGKTGTAQKPVPGRGYRSGKYMSSFVGFVKGVSPNYVVYVMIDEPKYPYFGGETAAPIFRRVMTAALAREGIAPDSNLIKLAANTKTPGRRDPPRKVVDKTRTTSSAPVVPTALVAADDNWLMPDLRGLTAHDVMDLFSSKDLHLQIRGSGLVKAQIPAAGALLKKGENVAVRLEREVSVP
ncbi:MAG: penicillin-binding protein [Bdellovibrionota bacterium]